MIRLRRRSEPSLDPAWLKAQSLIELGELTAQWLEGTIPTQPGYGGGPAKETRELVPLLAAINRMGYLTWSSQPAGTNRHGRKRAAVEGFCDLDMADRIRARATEAGCIVIVREPVATRFSDRADREQPPQPVTMDSTGLVLTVFGRPHTWASLRDIYAGCSFQAVEDVAKHCQVTVVDRDFGRTVPMLWGALLKALELPWTLLPGAGWLLD